MKDHPVGQGECCSSIAFDNGFFWKTLWEHEGNAALRARRKSAFTLVAGEDVVRIPDLRLKEEACATAKLHTFRRRGVPARLKLTLLHHDGTPRANEEYFLEVDGEMVSTDKKTDGAGKLQEFIRPDAGRARLFLDGGVEVHELDLGRLEPPDTTRGAQARLEGLGHYDGPIDGVESPALADAMERFRLAEKIDASTPDQALREKIGKKHDR